jgi:hypothetical protein
MLAEVDRTQRLLPYQGPGNPRVLGLSAAVRVFVLRDLMEKLALLNNVPTSADEEDVVHIREVPVVSGQGHHRLDAQSRF